MYLISNSDRSAVTESILRRRFLQLENASTQQLHHHVVDLFRVTTGVKTWNGRLLVLNYFIL